MSDTDDDAAELPPSTKMGVCTFLVIFLMSALPTVAFVLGYSGIGYGLEVTAKSYDYHDEAVQVVEYLLIFALFLYLLDSHTWPIILQIPCYLLLFVGFCAILLLMVTETPYGPLCVLTVLVPLLLIGIKDLCYKHVPGHVYAIWMHSVLVTQGVALIVVFFSWALRGENFWDAPTRAIYSDRGGCKIDFEGLEQCAGNGTVPCFWTSTDKVDVEFNSQCRAQCLDIYEECEEAFIIWSNPFLAAMALIVIGFISLYLKPDDPQAHHGISAVVRFFAIFLFLFWIFASLAGAGDGLSSSLIAYALSMCVGSSIIMSVVFWKKLTSTDTIGGAYKQAEAYLDLLKGLVILAFTPLLILYLLICALNQLVRRTVTCCCPCFVRLTEEEKAHRGCLTKRASNQVEDFKRWNHSRVLVYAVYWGIGYVFLNVLASKLTTVFLSWLIERTSDMDIPAVTLIVFGVGMVLFMLPPIPGLPIYLTAGIVLVSVGMTSMGLVGAIGYAFGVSLVLKLCACSVQQALIGAQLGGNIGIRQLVSINSEGVRAMRVVLSDRGMTARKVAVLVGGPDWPVSVLCGILGLDLLPVLVGTIPVVALIVPTVLCGSFAYMGSLENEDGSDLYPWSDTMGAVASAFSAGAMFYFTLSAAGAVKSTLANDQLQIDAIPMDEEVAEADAAAQKKASVYGQATSWHNVPILVKLCLILSALAMMGCVYLLVLFNAQCFREYDLMYTIREHLGGKWYNIVLPLGQWALGFFVVSYLLLAGVFEAWAKRQTAKALREMESAEETTPLTASEAATYA